MRIIGDNLLQDKQGNTDDLKLPLDEYTRVSLKSLLKNVEDTDDIAIFSCNNPKDKVTTWYKFTHIKDTDCIWTYNNGSTCAWNAEDDSTEELSSLFYEECSSNVTHLKSSL
uniref:Uncharacterized protein n=1 Tax=Pithovirus LCPAC404 TaxID=2506597 RepID=A0A481ZC51_9VIRU|nr:MAG: hypothetical protein LCPAC404_01620 [Pithovirus LCPAC404]